MPAMQRDWIVRPIEPPDRPTWNRLYRGYGEFYGESLSDERLDLVWRWIHEDGLVVALAVESCGGDAPVRRRVSVARLPAGFPPPP